MQWLPLARRECRTILASKGTWLLAAVVVTLGYRPTYVGWDALGRDITIGYVQLGVSVLFPTGVLLLCCRSVLHERVTGSIKLLLALPLTRAHVLAGKFVGRFVGVGTATLVAVGVVAGLGVADHGPFSVLPFVGTVLATLLLTAALVAVGTAVSVLVRRSTTATAVVLLYFVVSGFWNWLVPPVYSAVTGVPVDLLGTAAPPASGPLFLLLRLTPNGAYYVVTNWILAVGNGATVFSTVEMTLASDTITGALVAESAFGDAPMPWYLHPAVGVAILLAWVVVPLGVAHRRFARGDAL